MALLARIGDIRAEQLLNFFDVLVRAQKERTAEAVGIYTGSERETAIVAATLRMV